MDWRFFDVVSSPSCSNYVLKKTADDNKVKYGLEAADTLNNNFYEPYTLKSVQSCMCRAGGCRLNKFAGNSKELLISIQQIDRWQEAPGKKLLETIPYNARAPGVLWSIKDDKLGFQVHIKEKPLTRREMLTSLSSIYNHLDLQHHSC